MTTVDIKEFIATLGIAESKLCYTGKLDNRNQRCIGSYPLKRSGAVHIPIGGISYTSYGAFPASFLVHWTENYVESENAARKLFDELLIAKNREVNGIKIKFIQMLMPEPQYVATDDSGAHEWVIEALIYYEGGKNSE